MKAYNLLTAPYYLILKIRHRLYDKGRKKSFSTSIPSIGLGNVTVGGTGKTPHCEMLIRMFSDRYRIAVVSRGYGRKTRGLREVQLNDSFRTVGDEPLQMKRKFPDTQVYVSESRLKAMKHIEASGNKPDLILFDDIMQHRRIRPTVLIGLTNYYKPFFRDSMLPFGRLRDIPYRMGAADITIVTKIPEEYSPDHEIVSEFTEGMKKYGVRNVFFSAISYGDPLPVFPEDAEKRYVYSNNAVYFSGIAHDSLFMDRISEQWKIKDGISFPDHRAYRKRDIRKIRRMSKRHPEAAIFTTEKDAVRMSVCPVPEEIRKKMFYIPIFTRINDDCRYTGYKEAERRFLEDIERHIGMKK